MFKEISIGIEIEFGNVTIRGIKNKDVDPNALEMHRSYATIKRGKAGKKIGSLQSDFSDTGVLEFVSEPWNSIEEAAEGLLFLKKLIEELQTKDVIFSKEGFISDYFYLVPHIPTKYDEMILMFNGKYEEQQEKIRPVHFEPQITIGAKENYSYKNDVMSLALPWRKITNNSVQPTLLNVLFAVAGQSSYLQEDREKVFEKTLTYKLYSDASWDFFKNTVPSANGNPVVWSTLEWARFSLLQSLTDLDKYSVQALGLKAYFPVMNRTGLFYIPSGKNCFFNEANLSCDLMNIRNEIASYLTQSFNPKMLSKTVFPFWYHSPNVSLFWKAFQSNRTYISSEDGGSGRLILEGQISNTIGQYKNVMSLKSVISMFPQMIEAQQTGYGFNPTSWFFNDEEVRKNITNLFQQYKGDRIDNLWFFFEGRHDLHTESACSLGFYLFNAPLPFLGRHLEKEKADIAYMDDMDILSPGPLMDKTNPIGLFSRKSDTRQDIIIELRKVEEILENYTHPVINKEKLVNEQNTMKKIEHIFLFINGLFKTLSVD